MQRIELTLANADQLVGSYQPQGSPKTLLYIHGFGGHRGGEKSAALALECQKQGITYAAFDFRGHGESGGKLENLQASRLLEDLQAIFTFLKEQGHTQISAVASSMGGFAAAWFALQNPRALEKCIFLAPAFRFLEKRFAALSEADLAEWKRTGFRRFKNSWLDVQLSYGLIAEREQFLYGDLVQRWMLPTLLFHGLADDIIPARESLEFANASTNENIQVRLFKAGDHRLTTFKDEIAQEACRFILK